VGIWKVGILGRIDLQGGLCQEIDWLGMDLICRALWKFQ
jgi:hypothetical protein